MALATWFILIGSLLLLIGMRYPIIQRLPLTPSIIYLSVGVILGPTLLGAFHFNPLKQSHLLEVITEVAALISLFIAGIKMPMPFKWRQWRAPIRLAFASMAISVALTALFGYYLLSLPLGAAILLGGILAPTDPVLATDVQVRHMGDRDPLRFTLTSEAGMNDGTAFPFIMLGLMLLEAPLSSTLLAEWVLHDLILSTALAVIIGIIMGSLLAHAVWRQRHLEHREHLMDDFLGLGLIGLVYGTSLLLNAWGFLAVFIAAITLRHTELRLSQTTTPTAPLNEFSLDQVEPEAASEIRTSAGALVFKEPLERLSELVLVLLIGGMLFVDSWSIRAVSLALFLFFIVRPASVLLGLVGSGTPFRNQLLVGWFGVRGIGSLYYLMFAVVSGIPSDIALELIHITLVVVALSIILHGITVKPIMSRLWH